MVSRTLITRFAAGLLVWAAFSLAYAQSDDPTIGMINVGSAVFDTITSTSTFDVWEFQAFPGEHYRADMQGFDGLIPLLGLRDPGGDVIVASNTLEDGTVMDTVVDGTATVFFEIPAEGLYALVATRAGRDQGTTTGSYRLEMLAIGGESAPVNNYLDVTFRCGRDTVTSALGLLFGDQGEPADAYVVTAYGFDGFEPILRLGGDDGDAHAPCEIPLAVDAGLTLEFSADGQTFTFDDERITGVAVYTISDTGGDVLITLGSRNGLAGSYALHISGLSIETPDDSDHLVMRAGPRAKDTATRLWMLRDGLSRLDPYISVPEGGVFCLDIGLRTCDARILNTGVAIRREGSSPVLINRLDAAALFDSGSTDPVSITLASQNKRTTGQYALWFWGMLPAAESAP